MLRTCATGSPHRISESYTSRYWYGRIIDRVKTDHICGAVQGRLRTREAPMTEDTGSTSASRSAGSVDAVWTLTGGARVEAAGTTVIVSRPVAGTGRRYACRTGSGHPS